MERLDLAMRRATLSGGNNWAVEEGNISITGRGSVRWRTLLEKPVNWVEQSFIRKR